MTRGAVNKNSQMTHVCTCTVDELWCELLNLTCTSLSGLHWKMISTRDHNWLTCISKTPLFHEKQLFT